MKHRIAVLGMSALGLVFFLSVEGVLPLPVAAQNQLIVIDGGTLIDGTGRAPVARARLVVQGNRIREVGSQEDIQIPAGAKVIDTTAKFIMPGLIDAHVHYWEYLPELWINYGITTVIDTGNYMEYILSVREAAATGKLWGPRVFASGSGIAGPRRDRFVVNNAAEARAAAEEHVRRKVDFIKVFATITAEQLEAVTEVAHRAGIPVVGHLRIIDAREAALAGIDGLIHASGVSAALVPEPQAELIKTTVGLNPWGSSGGGLYHYQMDISKFDDLIRLLVERQIMIQPDLVHSAKGVIKQWDRFDLENRRLFDDPNLDYVPRYMRQRWFSIAYLKNAMTEEMERRREGYRKMMEFLGRFVAAGGVLLAGSDTVGSATPATTLHQELEVFVEDIGLTPMQALQTATKNPADFYRLEGLGTIEPGKFADLIVVKKDPLRDIRNTRSIDLVMKDGQVMKRGFHAWYTNPYRRPFRESPPSGGNPILSIGSVRPYVVTQGDKQVVLTIQGTGFLPECVVWLGETGLKTTFVSATELRAEVTEISLKAVGTFPVRVSRPHRGTGRLAKTSEPAYLMVKYR